MVRQDLDQPLNMRHRVGLTDNAVVGEKNRIVVLDEGEHRLGEGLCARRLVTRNHDIAPLPQLAAEGNNLGAKSFSFRRVRRQRRLSSRSITCRPFAFWKTFASCTPIKTED